MKKLWKNLLSPKLVFGCASDESSTVTLRRLSESRHVGDLRVVFAVTVYVVLIGCVVLTLRREWLSFGPFLVVCGGIISWTYQSGSARLGIVDLFACEISTLCRVCTITDLTCRHIKAFNVDLPTNEARSETLIERTRSTFSRYDPGESYSPIFDQHAAELRVLDVGVVTDVTAFYTYLKAMKDNLRSLAKINSFECMGRENDSWHEALKNVIYMEFLAFESARKAIAVLIEYEPKRTENMLTILISEVRAYHFLLDHFQPESESDEDFRHARLRLRGSEYQDLIGNICNRVTDVMLEFTSPNRVLSKMDEAHMYAWQKCIPTAQQLYESCGSLFGEAFVQTVDPRILTIPESSATFGAQPIFPVPFITTTAR
jgi:hypothetical protein